MTMTSAPSKIQSMARRRPMGPAPTISTRMFLAAFYFVCVCVCVCVKVGVHICIIIITLEGWWFQLVLQDGYSILSEITIVINNLHMMSWIHKYIHSRVIKNAELVISHHCCYCTFQSKCLYAFIWRRVSTLLVYLHWAAVYYFIVTHQLLWQYCCLHSIIYIHCIPLNALTHLSHIFLLVGSFVQQAKHIFCFPHCSEHCLQFLIQFKSM